MSTNAIGSGIPNSPIAVPASGAVTTEWFRFFVALFNRTGGGQGVDFSTLVTQAQLAAEAAARIAGDDTLGFEITAEAASRLAGDAANAAAIGNEAGIRATADAALSARISAIPSPGSGLMPLVNGDLPGPGLMVDQYGALIGVPV